MSRAIAFHLPTRPYTPIDSLNRRALAIGDVQAAAKAARADYNGHAVSVAWNEYRAYYVAEYFWAGRVVLARGSFEACLSAGIREHERGALGASLRVYLREGDAEAAELCRARGLAEGEEQALAWLTWKHQAAAEGARDAALPQCPVLLFDWELMQAADTRAEYESALRAKYGRVYG
jgi:hypothetical protein